MGGMHLKIQSYINVKHISLYLKFTFDTFKRMFFPFLRTELLFKQMEFVGVKSFTVIVLASFMIGAVFAIQFGSIFKLFGAESMIGAAASFSLSKELAPVIGAFLVTGRAGAAMAAETATMKVNEQIDAMKVMSVNPVGYLASPRVLASMIMMPLLSGFFLIGGICSCFVVGVIFFDIDVGIFLEKIKWISKPKHIFQGLQKAVIFGALFSSIACFKGFYAEGGAKGVGRATTQAVVVSLVIILLVDVFISYLQLEKLF